MSATPESTLANPEDSGSVGSKISTSRSAFRGMACLMQAPAVGRGLCELLLHGRYQMLDLSRLGYRRIRDGMPLRDEVPKP